MAKGMDTRRKRLIKVRDNTVVGPTVTDGEVGGYLRAARKRTGLGLSDLETLTGVNKAALSKYERALAKIPATTFLELLSWLQVPDHPAPDALFIAAVRQAKVARRLRGRQRRTRHAKG